MNLDVYSSSMKLKLTEHVGEGERLK